MNPFVALFGSALGAALMLRCLSVDCVEGSAAEARYGAGVFLGWSIFITLLVLGLVGLVRAP